MQEGSNLCQKSSSIDSSILAHEISGVGEVATEHLSRHSSLERQNLIRRRPLTPPAFFFLHGTQFWAELLSPLASTGK